MLQWCSRKIALKSLVSWFDVSSVRVQGQCDFECVPLLFVLDMFVTCNSILYPQNNSVWCFFIYYMSSPHGCLYSNKKGLNIPCTSWRPNISQHQQHSWPQPHCCHEVLLQTGETGPTTWLLCTCIKSGMPKAVNTSCWTSGWKVNNLWGVLWCYRCPAHTIPGSSHDNSSKNVYSDQSAWKTALLEAIPVEEAYWRPKGLGTFIPSTVWIFLVEGVVYRQVQIQYFWIRWQGVLQKEGWRGIPAE